MMKIRLLFMVAIILLFTGTNAMAGAFEYNYSYNGTVTDKRFELIWQQESSNEIQTWTEAKNYCKALDLPLPYNYSKWRLPDIKELAFLTDDTTHSPAIDKTYFPDTKTSFYWSATAVAGQRETPAWWGVNFNDGHVAGYGDVNQTDNKRYVRCVSEPSGAN